MNFIGELTDALAGSADLLAGRSRAAERFRRDRRGLAVPLTFVVLAVLLVLAAQSANGGMQTFAQLLIAVLVHAITLLILALAVDQILRGFHLPVPPAVLLIPTIWAFGLFLLLRTLLSPFGIVAGLPLLLVTAYFEFQVGRILGQLPVRAALTLAVVVVLVLVAVHNALYMLLDLLPYG